jgi:hypothetical protein
MTAIIRNEKRKLSATWCNTLATAILTAGTFAPLAATFYGLSHPTISGMFLMQSAMVCAAIAIAFHFVGRLMIGRLEEQ